jgi:hypothetical protein|nr:MAG TPA: hypothetical protein [Caudoviricetes sp.]
MKCFVITINPYAKYGPFKDQISAIKYGNSLKTRYKIVWKDY